LELTLFPYSDGWSVQQPITCRREHSSLETSCISIPQTIVNIQYNIGKRKLHAEWQAFLRSLSALQDDFQEEYVYFSPLDYVKTAFMGPPGAVSPCLKLTTRRDEMSLRRPAQLLQM
jgi:hypothetical protein